MVEEQASWVFIYCCFSDVLAHWTVVITKQTGRVTVGGFVKLLMQHMQI